MSMEFIPIIMPLAVSLYCQTERFVLEIGGWGWGNVWEKFNEQGS